MEKKPVIAEDSEDDEDEVVSRKRRNSERPVGTGRTVANR